MSPGHVQVGFEVGTGKPVVVPIGHMVVCGQTQLSGKTTLLEAAASRCGRPVLAFRTKRGEGAFAGGRRAPAYFQERADWQFVESILESTMRQKMRFERAWIMRACRGARTLAAVQVNVTRLMGEARRGMDRDMYMMLGEYLGIVVPVLARLPAQTIAALDVGIHVVDMRALPEEVQGLVIASWLGRVHREEEGVVTVIPESWKYLPQGRNSPVKMAAAKVAREGAALGNLLWMDAQDLAGLEKEHQRGASVWCLGVQREMNEVKRNLSLIPAGFKKPKVEDVARLGLGQFWVCQPDGVTRTYVWPAWATQEAARAAAVEGTAIFPPHASVPSPGTLAVLLERQAIAEELRGNTPVEEETEMADPETTKAIEKMTARLDTLIGKLDAVLPLPAQTAAPSRKRDRDVEPSPEDGPRVDEEALFQRIVKRLSSEAPDLIRVLAIETRMEIEVQEKVLEVDGDSLKGRIGRLIVNGFFDGDGRSGQHTFEELIRLGFKPAKPGVYRELDALAEEGFFVKEIDAKRGNRYVAVADRKPKIRRR